MFLSFIISIFARNVSLVSPLFRKRSLVFLILLSYSISLHYSLKKAFLSLLTILGNSAFSWVYLSLWESRKDDGGSGITWIHIDDAGGRGRVMTSTPSTYYGRARA